MDDDRPLAYLITFRCYGTWLHGDERGSVDRFHKQYGSPYLQPNDARRYQNEARLKHEPVTLSPDQRLSVERAIQHTCQIRGWPLRAVSARTNHVHVLVSAEMNRAEQALNAFKANATRQLRDDGQWRQPHSPWSDGGSKRYVWTALGIERAIDYVMNQGAI